MNSARWMEECRRSLRGVTLAVCLLLGSVPLAKAVDPDEILADRALEARARAISSGLRCLVCQNQSIDDSNAPLAKDLRVLVRDRLKAGDDDQSVTRYIVERYGEFVLLKPRLSPRTLLLWLAPVLLLLGAAIVTFRHINRSNGNAAAPMPLSREDEKRLAKILEDE
jgi:cytochrome c-type biogenesis protein CcmH